MRGSPEPGIAKVQKAQHVWIISIIRPEPDRILDFGKKGGVSVTSFEPVYQCDNIPQD